MDFSETFGQVSDRRRSATRRRKHRVKPRIKLTAGQWYAHAPSTTKGAMLLLVPAIRFAARLNAARALRTPQPADAEGAGPTT